MLTFNSQTARRIVGITRRQIDYWDRTHFIKPSIREASGYGSVRLYSFRDLVQLRVAKEMLDRGITIQKIRKSVNWLKRNLPDVEKPLAELKLITDGETIFSLTDNRKALMDTLKQGQMCFLMIISIDEHIKNLKREIKTISEERKYKVNVKGRTYEVVLHPDLEDKGFWVECPSLPGCASQGDTVEEALAMIKDAVKGHLEVVKEIDSKKAKAGAA